MFLLYVHTCKGMPQSCWYYYNGTKERKGKSKKNAIGSHKLWPQRRHWVKIFSLVTRQLKTSRNSPNNQLHKYLFLFSKTIVSTFATLPALSSHDFCKEKERKVKIDVQDVQDVQDARVTVKRKALTVSASKVNNNNLQLKGDMQSEGILYICNNECSLKHVWN